jgi:hypothetical protein
MSCLYLTIRRTRFPVAAIALGLFGCSGAAATRNDLAPEDSGADRTAPPTSTPDGAAPGDGAVDASETSVAPEAGVDDGGSSDVEPEGGSDTGDGGADAGPSEAGEGGPEAGPEGGPSIVVLGTDTSWQMGDAGYASLVSSTCIASTWVAAPAYATWIWSSPCTATDTASETFSRVFDIGAFASATLSIAVDDYAIVTINGVSLPATCSIPPSAKSPAIHAVACGFATAAALDVTSYLKEGPNRIDIEVDNVPMGSPPGWGNPAGVLAWVTVR